MFPDLYAQEQRRIAEKMEQAVMAAEAAAAEQLTGMLQHLIERASGVDESGKPLTIRETSISKIRDYCQYFRTACITGTEGLDSVIEQIEELANGTTAKEIRRRGQRGRERIAEQATALRSALVGVAVHTRAARKITLPEAG